MNINTAAYGPLRTRYVTRIRATLDKCLEAYPRTMVLRVDLHLPSDKINIYRKDDGLVTKFISSLRSQICAHYTRKKKDGIRVYHTDIRYIWVREFGQIRDEIMEKQEESLQVHYHVALLINKDAYAYPGAFFEQGNTSSHNLSFMIMQAWVRALSLHCEDQHEKHYSLVHFPENPYYHLNSNQEDFKEKLKSVLDRLDYLAKIYSKDSSDGYRNFGCSQG